MSCKSPAITALLAAMCLSWLGCALHGPSCELDLDDGYYRAMATELKYPDGTSPDGPASDFGAPPLSLDRPSPPPTWDLSLEEAVQLALSRSKVMRELGGSVLRFPNSVRTIYSPAIQASDPRFGTEAALSAFDAQLGTDLFFANNDRALNNLLREGTNLFQQDVNNYRFELSKQTAAGTAMALRHNTDYDANNSPANLFPSAWNTNFEAEVRQPLMQGAGVQFNRIAGPDGAPGVMRGVVISRLDTDVSLAEFRIGLRNMVSNVENAYWDLYFAYRDLEARTAARDASLETWRVVKTRMDTGRRGGEAEKEAQAREQYFRLQEQVQDGLTGRLLQRTRTFNGSAGGTFRGITGVYAAERRLRLAIGLPINDGRLICPVEDPVMARVIFDWMEIAAEAVTRRAELRRQKDLVERANLELIASRNFLLPRLDTVGLYRWRGFGHDLMHPSRDNKPRFDNAFADLTSGDFQEWQLGLELAVPIGYRQGHAAVRNAQLRVAQQRAILEEQERQIVYGLSNAVAELDRAQTVIQTGYNRLVAAQQQLDAAEAAFEADRAPVDLVLDAQERLADARGRFTRSRVEYALAVKNVHFEKGSLLDYHGVFLAGGSGPNPACSWIAPDGRGRSGHRRPLSYALPQDVAGESSPRPLPDMPSPPPIQPYGQDAAGRLRGSPVPMLPNPMRAPGADVCQACFTVPQGFAPQPTPVRPSATKGVTPLPPTE